ncbi:acetate kinase [Desulforhopalus vacuolatus]|uniref:acetate kinase n=1 Tax=Desulforhopalus vacuolatus TaxID=40414 RepID=UPI00196413D3|nr:acetate kinase [Desulforhopalus vacuolatus]MBM9519071.1 acetate kinase [Desulforhopalus vacuolatus]
MKALVINSGSSSLKFQLLDMDNESVLASGLVERIGDAEGNIKCTFHPDTEKESVVKKTLPIPTHTVAGQMVVDLLTDKEHGVLADKSEVGVIGHRVVHGGENFSKTTLLNDAAIAALEDTVPLAPLHNTANLDGIRIAQELFPGVPQVGVFDTAFHQTLPPHAFRYAIPKDLYEKDRIRRYGFHGTSHKYVVGECAKLCGIDVDKINAITVHLGNGGSITAVENGKSVDTSMGFTPLQGLVMGTRSGDIDPSVHAFLARNHQMSCDEIDNMLNKESGLKGLCGLNDMRDIHAAIEKGDKDAELALAVQTYRTKKYIGAYMAVLGRVDAIVFTAGIGENDDIVREMSLAGLENFGIILDTKINAQRVKTPTLLSTPESKVQIWCIPTNEELAIAREAVALVSK